MKRLFILLIVLLPPVFLFAQGKQNTATYGTVKPKVVVKQDTTVYAAETFTADNGRLDGLLLQMKDFELGDGGTIVHNGQAVKYVEINGQSYRGLDAQRASIMFPANMVHTVEIIDVHSQPNGPVDKVMNINMKSNRNDQLADILVGARFVNNITDLKMSAKRQDALANATPALFLGPPIGSDKDVYGDQIPHFIIKPAPGTYDYKTGGQPIVRVRGRGRMRNVDPTLGNTYPPIIP